MTRNDIKALFPEATTEQINNLLDINSNDVGKAKSGAKATQEQLEEQISGLNERIKTMSDQAKDLNNQIKALTSDVAQRDSAIQTLRDEKDAALNNLKAEYEVSNKTLTDNHANELKALQDQLKAAQEKASVVDTLSERVAKLTSDVADRDATIRSTNKQYKIREELRNRKARDIDVIMPLLKVDEITDEDGKLNGLNEQLDAIEKTYSYLFNVNPGNQRGGFSGNPDTGDHNTANDVVNKAIRALSGHN